MANKVNIEKLNVILIFLVLAFAAFTLFYDAQNAKASSIEKVEDIHLYANATSTPFQPIEPTATPTSTQTPVPPQKRLRPLHQQRPFQPKRQPRFPGRKKYTCRMVRLHSSFWVQMRVPMA